jgi:hypothetical protein
LNGGSSHQLGISREQNPSKSRQNEIPGHKKKRKESTLC